MVNLARLNVGNCVTLHVYLAQHIPPNSTKNIRTAARTFHRLQRGHIIFSPHLILHPETTKKLHPQPLNSWSLVLPIVRVGTWNRSHVHCCSRTLTMREMRTAASRNAANGSSMTGRSRHKWWHVPIMNRRTQNSCDWANAHTSIFTMSLRNPRAQRYLDLWWLCWLGHSQRVNFPVLRRNSWAWPS